MDEIFIISNDKFYVQKKEFFNSNKNILGMMPHPERMIDKYLSGEDGSLFFKNILDNFK